MATSGGSPRRPRTMPTKGDRREREILEAAEELLSTVGVGAMTVESIANRVGITRAALYFYFRSKQDVIAALLKRSLSDLHSTTEDGEHGADLTAQECITLAVRSAARAWREHGPVVRAAGELSTSVPEIGQMWITTMTNSAEHMAAALVRGGLRDDDSPGGARRIAMALTWMGERSLYWATRSGDPEEIELAFQTCEAAWLAVLPS